MKLITTQKNFMNTVITIKFVKDKESTVAINDAIEKAFGEFDRIVKKFTRFNENSELSNLNRNAGKWTEVSEEFLFLIKYMLDLYKKSDGAFDPTIIDFLEIYGYDKNYDFSKLKNPVLDDIIKNKTINRRLFSEIEINEKINSIRLGNSQRIDLGGIGKGYAIDCAFKHLKNIGDNFLIDGGGDLRASGKNEKQELWKASLKTMNEKGLIEELGQIELSDEALASSGSWARKVKQFHHLINPKTGRPIQTDYKTVFVKTPTAIEADSWATTLFVGGKDLEIPKNYFVSFV